MAEKPTRPPAAKQAAKPAAKPAAAPAKPPAPAAAPAAPTIREAAPAGDMPPLYARVRPIDPQRHEQFAVLEARDFKFAAKTRAVPITGAEFPVAAREYPIVFVTKPSPMAAVLVGLRADENLYVGDDGKWRQGAYMPAYLRRYPFLIAQSNDGQRLILCIDEGSPLVSTEQGMRFFENGKKSAYLDRMLQLGADIHRDQVRTAQIVKLLGDLGLLIERRIEAKLASGETVGFQGFGIVDERKLNELPDDKFLELRKSGGLGLVYLHLVSFANLRHLGDIAVQRGKKTA
ncbi:MAG: SapC family protein [Proteobacteria bacterium]|nr:SapC family protein [Pseudomonadota bacterium]